MYKNVPNHQPNEFSVFSRLEKGEQCFFLLCDVVKLYEYYGPPP